MISRKVLVRLLAALSVVMVGALAFSVLSMTAGSSHAAGVASGPTPRFYTFHHTFSNIAASRNSGGGALATWTSSFASGGITYNYTMVGTNPTKGAATTTIPTTIVPLILKFSNGTFDGTQKVSNTTNSPIFQNAQFSSGKTQYGDAIQRAEFWKKIPSPKNYHVLVGTPTVATALTINVPSANGAIAKDPSSGKNIGIIDINWFDPVLQGELTA